MVVVSGFPGVRAAMKNSQKGPLSVAQVQDGLDKFFMLAGDDKGGMRFGAAIMAAKIYPVAKKYLIKQGRTPDQVDALPVTQVALMYALSQHDTHFDNIFKSHNLPFWEADPEVNNATKQLKESKSKIMETGGIPIAELLIPAVSNMLSTRAR